LSDLAIGSVSLGLSAAVVWGAADFAGGMATKRTNVYGVVVGSEVVGLILLTPLAILAAEPFPTFSDILLAGLAGLCGGFGLTLLYRALAGGLMSIAAPVSALVGAALPVLIGALFEGFPKPTVFAGIGLALLAILLISSTKRPQKGASISLSQLILPVTAGIFFGLFFILINQASQTALLWPVIVTRIASICLLIAVANFSHQPWIPSRVNWPLISLSGLFDTGGNVFYVSAAQIGRLDIAAVLSSLYPASTVIMAWLILREHVSTIQMVGILLALLAILLIVL
jgi:drug/metabolite transporter (DMT)-like permease